VTKGKYLPQRGFETLLSKLNTASLMICTSDTNLLTYLLTPWNRVLLEKLTGSAASQEIPPIFWNPKDSSPYSQVPATCPYPEPTPSSPHNPLSLPEDPS